MLVAALALAGCGGDEPERSGPAADAARRSAGDAPLLVFSTDAGQARYGVFTVRADGSGLRRLTGNIGALAPHWLPSGRQISYTTVPVERPGGIWVMDADGKRKHPYKAARPSLPGQARGDDWPSWSPDGKLLAVQAFVEGAPGFQVVEVVRVDGSGRRRLAGARGADAQSPAFSPDGKLIAYEVRGGPLGPRSFDDAVFVIDVAGGAGRRLTPKGWIASSPVWIPGQDRVAFDRLEGTKFSVWSVRPGGGGLRRERVGFNPDWSDDGRRVAYVDDVDGNRELFVANADGSGRKRITRDLLDQGQPDWAPKGAR